MHADPKKTVFPADALSPLLDLIESIQPVQFRYLVCAGIVLAH
jgi:hypothetical protein